MVAAIRQVLLDTDAFEPQHRLDVWRDFYAGLTEVQPRLDSGNAPRARLQGWRVGDLIIGRHEYSACVTSAAQGSDHDRLILRMLVSGKSHSFVGDTPVMMQPGAVYLRDRTRPYVGIHDDVEVRSISVPFEAVGYDPHDPPEQLSFDFRTPFGRVLKVSIDALYESLPDITPAQGAALGDGFAAMVRAVINHRAPGDKPRHHFERGRELTIRRYVRAHLRDRDLSAEQICHALGVSRATLFRIFKAEGGVARYILSSRLEHSLLDLARSTPRRGVVGIVAARWAFRDAAQFSRQFQANFGFTPSDVIGTGSAHRADDGAAERATRSATATAIASLVNEGA